MLAATVAAPALAQGRPAPPPKPEFDNSLAAKVQDTTASPNERLRVIVKYRGTAANAKSKLNGRVDRIQREHRAIGAISVEMKRGRLKEICSLEGISCSDDARVRTKSQLLTTDTQDPSLVTTGVTSDGGTTSLSGNTDVTTSTTTTTDTTAGSMVTADSLVDADSLLTTSAVTDGQQLRATLGLRSWQKGAGVGVAVVDSGIAPTWDLANRVTAFYDFTAGGVAAPLSDGYGHGTHVAGLIAGNGHLSSGKYVGIAPKARLIGLKVLDSQGAGYTSDVIAAIEFAIANRTALGIDVMNLSLGHPVFERPETDPLVQAVEAASAAGIVVVASAGNWGLDANDEVGYGGITSPGNAASALTVGAMRTKATASRADDEIALFSSRGPTWYDGRVKPDVVTPGQALVAVSSPTSVLGSNPLLQVAISPYIKLSGTSMAAGVASGVVALMIEANRLDEGASSRLTPNTVKALLQYTAIPVPQTWSPAGAPDALAQGAGGINGGGAIELTRAINPSAASGEPWLEAAVHPYTTIAGTTHRWAQSIIWGDHFVTSDTLAWNLPVWAQGVIWGDDDGVVWGDDDGVVWGDSFHGLNLVVESFYAWSSHVVWGDGLVALDDGVVWGDDDGVVWTDDDGVVWGDVDDDGVVWGDDDGVIWGDDDGVVWGNTFISFLED
jgi:serine protease AprX